MKVFVIAGEPSGDNLGAAVMAGLRAQVPGVRFDGIGGPAMAAEGLQSRFEMAELSLMGIAEVLPKYFHLKRRIAETAAAVLDQRPDILLTIDSPDFCLRVAAAVRAQAHIRTVHYVAPTVWAWRPGRAAKMAPHVDQVLCLFPFEPPLMQAAGMQADFVGHPVVTAPPADPVLVAALRDGPGPLVLALPGSRKGEVTRLAERFGQTLGLLQHSHPGLRVVLPTAAPVTSLVRDLTAGWPVQPLIIAPDEDLGGPRKRAAFAAADVALAASGTVSLELAAAGTPMVIGYDMAPLSRWLIGRMLRVDTVTLVNLVSETRHVPEFIGQACRPEPMAAALASVLADPAPQRAAMAVTMDRLGRGGPPPGERAAQAILARM
jgi:lipid-A-disaccharide synthase